MKAKGLKREDTEKWRKAESIVLMCTDGTPLLEWKCDHKTPMVAHNSILDLSNPKGQLCKMF